MFESEPDPQAGATDASLSAMPADWAEYTEAQKLAAPRGAIFETRLAASEELRALGNAHVAAADLAAALKCYERSFWQADFEEAFVKLEMTERHQRQTYEMQVPVRLNIAQCILKTAGGDLSVAKAHIDTCLEACDAHGLNSKPKVLYWRAKVRLRMGMYDEAEDDLLAVLLFLIPGVPF